MAIGIFVVELVDGYMKIGDGLRSIPKTMLGGHFFKTSH